MTWTAMRRCLTCAGWLWWAFGVFCIIAFRVDGDGVWLGRLALSIVAFVCFLFAASWCKTVEENLPRIGRVLRKVADLLDPPKPRIRIEWAEHDLERTRRQFIAEQRVAMQVVPPSTFKTITDVAP